MTSSKPRQLTREELECLKRFAVFEISLEDLRRCLRGVFEFHFNWESGIRTSEDRFLVPKPGIPITRRHIENALDKKRLGLITEQQLVEWATVILHNHAYELDPKDEDLIAGWLNDISFDLNPSPD
jgi:hypothetical protein